MGLLAGALFVALAVMLSGCPPKEDDNTPQPPPLPPGTVTGDEAAPQLDTGTFGIFQAKAGAVPPLTFPEYPVAWAWKPEDPNDREIWLFYRLDEFDVTSGNPIGFIRPGDELKSTRLNIRQIIGQAGGYNPPGTTPADGIDLADYNAFRDWVIQQYANPPYNLPGVTRQQLLINDHEFVTNTVP